MNQLPSPPSPPTLEALLKLKRSERPDAAFWAEFEHGLRQKQLAAIVEPKPWWLGLRLALRRPAPWIGGLAAGAAAVVVIGLPPIAGFDDARPRVASVMSAPSPVRAAEMRPETMDLAVQAPSSAGATASATPAAREAIHSPTGHDALALKPPAGTTARAEPQPRDLTERLLEQATATVASLVVGMEPRRPESAGFLVASASVGPGATAPSVVSAAAEVFADDEPVFSLDSGALASLANGNASALAHAQPEKAVSAPANSRHSRLLAAVSETGAISSLQALAQVRDQVLHRMGGDDELYASISRLGVSGDRLSVRF